jgi:hypothetical protein
MNIKMFRRKVSIFGVAVASVFGAPLPAIKKSHEEEGENPGTKIVDEEGIISSKDIVQGEWHGYSAMDNHLYRYESMENLVSHENEIDGKFWKTATFLTQEEDRHVISGIRSDDMEFSLERTFDIRDKMQFNQLCQDFNKNLKVKTV